MWLHAKLGVLALADQAFVSATTFFTMILVTRWCSDLELTIYALTWSVFGFVRVAQERLIAAPYVVFTHDDTCETKTFLGSSLVHQMMFSLVSVALLVPLALAFAIRGTPVGMSTATVALLVGIPVILLRDHVRSISAAHFHYVAALTMSVAVFVVQLGGIVIANYFGVLSIPVVFLLMGVACLVPAAGWLLLPPQPYRIDKTRLRADWRTTWQYSRWLAAARCFPTAASALMPWIVLCLVDEHASGRLAACLTLVGISMMFITGANNYFQPRAIKALHASGKRAMCMILLESVAVFSVVLIGLCFVYVFFGEWLLSRIYGDKLAGCAGLVSVLGLNVLLVSFSIVAGNGMAALGKPRGLFWGEFSFAIATIAVALVVTPYVGLMGAAIAMCCGSTVATIVASLALLKLLRSYTSVS